MLRPNPVTAVAAMAVSTVLGAVSWGVVGAANAGSSAPSDLSTDRRVQHLRVHFEPTNFKGVDVGRQGDSPGDYFLFAQKWYNAAGTRVIGRALARCEIGLPATRRTCEVTGRIDGRGKIRFAGTSFRASDRVNVVTGGTGDFLGVGGVMHLHPTRPLFEFKLVR